MAKMNQLNSQKFDLLLINPSVNYEKDRKDILARRVETDVAISNCPSPGIGYMISNIKKSNYTVKFIDMVAEMMTVEELLKFIRGNKPIVVGFTALTVQIKAAGFIANEIKKLFPEIVIGVGGIHATIMPKETLEEFQSLDFAVCGEGEYVVVDILKNIHEKKTISSIKGVVTKEKDDVSYERINNIDNLPFPDWEEMDLSKYGGIYPHRTRLELPVWTSRGCPFSCIFCVRPLGRHRRHRSIDSIISEIEKNIDVFGCESIAFIDETFIVDLPWSSLLFNTMIEKGLNKKISWSCETRVDTVTPELFKLMKKAGCYYVFFGLESGDNVMLKKCGKNFTTTHMKDAVRWAKDAGIIPSGSFIIGLPGETEETVRISITLAQELDLYSVTFPIAVPFPGTILRKMAINQEYGLKILTNNWDDYDKQYPGVMESEDLSIEKRREMQKLAYTLLPKKKISEYIEKLNLKRI